MRLTKAELAMRLRELPDTCFGDEEDWHVEADKLLLEYINDQAVTDAFNSFRKWYA